MPSKSDFDFDKAAREINDLSNKKKARELKAETERQRLNEMLQEREAIARREWGEFLPVFDGSINKLNAALSDSGIRFSVNTLAVGINIAQYSIKAYIDEREFRTTIRLLITKEGYAVLSTFSNFLGTREQRCALVSIAPDFIERYLLAFAKEILDDSTIPDD